MTAIVAYGAISALGEGDAALDRQEPGEPARTRVLRDDELAAAGLLRPFCARAPLATPDRDRATVLLERALAACASELDRVLPAWREKRVGLAIGTSSGGMRSFEKGVTLEGTYLGPVLAAARPCAFEPFALVLGACASGTLAIGLAREWLRAGTCDVALAGGFDAVSVFVAAGFEALRATCSEKGPHPFRKDRDGLALGEGAAIVAMVPSSPKALAYVRGFGATCDATHLTAPDRTGAGLTNAAKQALGGRHQVDLISAHGTATPFNDAAETEAMRKALTRAPFCVHAMKGVVGHTLGAAGALELLAGIEAMRRGIGPASAGEGTHEGGVRILDRAERGRMKSMLKLSSAFGGANAAAYVDVGVDVDLVDASSSSAGRSPPRDVYLSRGVAIEGEAIAEATNPRRLAEQTKYEEDRIARADLLTRLTIAAAAELEAREGDLAGAGILVGHGLATLETNHMYHARIRSAGAAKAEPRRFPFTTPNAAPGEAAIALGLTGPSFAVGGGPHGGLEALATAAALVAGGVADRLVVVAVDEAGPAAAQLAPDTTSGAVAVLVSKDPLAARLESATVHLDGASDLGRVPRDMAAHRALLPLAAGRPDRLDARMPSGGFANARLLWL